MNEQEKELTEKESLALITAMISKAKNAYYDTGVGAIMWGTVIAFCSLERLAEIHFGYRLPIDINYLTLLTIIPQVFISIKEKRERRVRTYEDALMGYLWLGFGIAIFMLIFIINAMFYSWRPFYEEYERLAGHAPPSVLYNIIAPLFLLLYGLPTFITGAGCKFKPMLWGGIFCWVCCIITIYTPIKIDLLLTALAAIFAWLVPGLILEKEYRKARKQLKEVHV
jgi:hypothetical protein